MTVNHVPVSAGGVTTGGGVPTGGGVTGAGAVTTAGGVPTICGAAPRPVAGLPDWSAVLKPSSSAGVKFTPLPLGSARNRGSAHFSVARQVTPLTRKNTLDARTKTPSFPQSICCAPPLTTLVLSWQ